MKIRYSPLMLFLLLLLGLLSCTSHSDSDHSGPGCGTLKMSEPFPPHSLYPPASKDISSTHIVSQIFEGLVRYNAVDLSVTPALAREWEIDTSGTVYTFHLRTNVLFHNNSCFPGGQGRRVNAGDVKYSFSLLCSQSKNNHNFYGTLDKVSGARSYYEASARGKPLFDVEGIKVVNDSVLQLILEKPDPGFIYFLANPAASVFPKEGITQYGVENYVGTGPFKLVKPLTRDQPLLLARNEHYYRTDKRGNPLPYMDSVIIYFPSSFNEELKLFESGKIDVLLGFPKNKVTEFVAKFPDQFKGNKPVFRLDPSGINPEVQTIFRSAISGLHTNSMDFLDLSSVAVKDPVPAE
jgi:oligopeptide transport system substrate-binding protein